MEWTGKKMIAPQTGKRILTGVRNLDEVLHGGIPLCKLTILAGTQGQVKQLWQNK